MAGHGGHWSCFGDEVGGIVDALVNEAAQDGAIIHQQAVATRDPETGAEAEQTLVALSHPDTDLRVMALVMSDAASGQNALVSAYPFCATAIPLPVTIQDIRVWDDKVEAQIIGHGPGDAILTFFDTHYFKNRERYEKGATLDFHLAALAYHAEPAKGQTIKFTDEKLLRAMSPSQADRNPNQAIEIPLDGAAIIFPHSEGDVDDYNYHVPVESVETFKLGAHTVHRVKTTFLRLEPAVESFLYVPAFVCRDGYVPTPGDDLAGAMWLQGYLAE